MFRFLCVTNGIYIVIYYNVILYIRIYKYMVLFCFIQLHLGDHNFFIMRPFSTRPIPLESPRRELFNGVFLIENGSIGKKL